VFFVDAAVDFDHDGQLTGVDQPSGPVPTFASTSGMNFFCPPKPGSHRHDQEACRSGRRISR